ncbi:hypothetical protein [Streptomyces coeruleorubidus]|uniref:hypothetical protein n=1 Tax=Streptomyces coeruleorubidus TaxID=116188 RepID=UPI00366A2082
MWRPGPTGGALRGPREGADQWHQSAHRRGWECPQYLPAASGPGALIFSAWNLDDGPQCVEALMGEEHGDVFEAGPAVLVDHGPDCCAPALLRAPGNRWLLWGWSGGEARDDAWAVADRWAGVLTLPREIHVDDGRLCQQPATELLALRGEHTIHAAGATHGPQPVNLGSLSPAFDLTARLKPTGNTGLRLLTTPHAELHWMMTPATSSRKTRPASCWPA